MIRRFLVKAFWRLARASFYWINFVNVRAYMRLYTAYLRAGEQRSLAVRGTSLQHASSMAGTSG